MHHWRWFACICCMMFLVTSCSSSTPVVTRPVTTPPAAPKTAAVPKPVPPTSATATMRDFVGNKIGTVTFADTHSGILISGTVSGLGLGSHGMHIHEFGQCTPPFTSAGDHFNPGKKRHGFKSPAGPHAGDLPNIDMPAAGTLHFDVLMAGMTLKGPNGILGPSGASLIIHMTADNYTTDPTGNSGGRQACGVIVEDH